MVCRTRHKAGVEKNACRGDLCILLIGEYVHQNSRGKPYLLACQSNNVWWERTSVWGHVQATELCGWRGNIEEILDKLWSMPPWTNGQALNGRANKSSYIFPHLLAKTNHLLIRAHFWLISTLLYTWYWTNTIWWVRAKQTHTCCICFFKFYKSNCSTFMLEANVWSSWSLPDLLTTLSLSSWTDGHGSWSTTASCTSSTRSLHTSSRANTCSAQ